MKFFSFDGKELGLIYIPHEEVDAQEFAMLGAMYSRTTDSVEQMVQKVTKEGSAKFMDKFVIGYGHESISDLVNVKIFIEGIPLYLAPLIEHHALFRGTESSTRYINFANQRLYGPEQDLMKMQIDEYLRVLTLVTDKLMEINKPETNVQKNAVKARAFDICRSLLPLGATTNVAWFGDIRSIKGHLAWMLNNHKWSTPWVTFIYNSLKDVYPASMEKKLEDIRPRQPWVFDKDQTDLLKFEGYMDFGSWRDMNRHRVGYQHFILPGPESKVYYWYLDIFKELDINLDEALSKEAQDVADIGVRLLGQQVPFEYSMPRSQAYYFVWRRAQMDVHPTLRLQVQKFGLYHGYLKEEHMQADVGTGYIERRGTQTILHKESGKDI